MLPSSDTLRRVSAGTSMELGHMQREPWAPTPPLPDGTEGLLQAELLGLSEVNLADGGWKGNPVSWWTRAFPSFPWHSVIPMASWKWELMSDLGLSSAGTPLSCRWAGQASDICRRRSVGLWNADWWGSHTWMHGRHFQGWGTEGL